MSSTRPTGFAALVSTLLLAACSAGVEDAEQQSLSDGEGVISGQISGPVVAGVAVALTGQATAMTTTDATGTFRFTGVGRGIYHVVPAPSRTTHFAPASVAVDSDGASESGGVAFTSYVPPQENGFTPPDIGSELWAWGWAGIGGANLTLEQGGRGMEITFMLDLSGRGNHFFNNGGYQAAYDEGVEVAAAPHHRAYATPLAMIGIERWPSGDDQFGTVYYQSQSLQATNDFYLACAMLNTRDVGSRELWGSDPNNNVILDQRENDLYVTMQGTRRRLVNGTIPYGPLLLEFWRDQAGVMTVFANGVKVSVDTVWHGTFDVSGFGWDGDGTSYYDDYLMELVYCDALPPGGEREQIRGYMRNKWGLY